MSRLFFSSQTLNTTQVHTALDALNLPTLGVEALNQQACIEIPEAYTLPKAAITDTLRPLARTHQFDFAILEAEFQANEFKLLAMDMDSTLITIECIDEIADFAGKKKKYPKLPKLPCAAKSKIFLKA